MMSGAEHEIRTLIAHGASLEEIEPYIDNLPLDPDHCSALWLLAWVKATNRVARDGPIIQPPAHVR